MMLLTLFLLSWIQSTLGHCYYFASDSYCDVTFNDPLIMGATPVADTTKSLVVSRNGVSLTSGASYVAGETLDVSVTGAPVEYAFTVNSGGATFIDGACGNTRHPFDSQVVMPSSGTVVLQGAWANQHGTLHVMSTFTLNPPGSTAAPLGVPTRKPSAVPVSTSTAVPTGVPVSTPTAVPVTGPTAVPVAVSTAGPTAVPIAVSTSVPTAGTAIPTRKPSAVPIGASTGAPTAVPVIGPTAVPIAVSTGVPTAGAAIPTRKPSAVPIGVSTSVPTTGASSTAPTTASPPSAALPTVLPSVLPVATTAKPTRKPSAAPAALFAKVATKNKPKMQLQVDEEHAFLRKA